MKHVTNVCVLLCATICIILFGVSGPTESQERTSPPTTEPTDAALARTRRTVQMLDDIYKQTVILITDKYVEDENDFPAGSAAVALFKHVTDKGWHKVRLIDATGDPYNSQNVARDDFEKKGIEELKKGQAYYEQVVQEDGQHRLRAITPIPVVMEKCVMCHAHYADVKKGDPIGAISYSLVID
jgi:hypothetical protein